MSRKPPSTHINVTDITKESGVIVSMTFVSETLDIKPDTSFGNSYLWKRERLPEILEAIGDHMHGLSLELRK